MFEIYRLDSASILPDQCLCISMSYEPNEVKGSQSLKELLIRDEHHSKLAIPNLFSFPNSFIIIVVNCDAKNDFSSTATMNFGAMNNPFERLKEKKKGEK